MKSRVIRVYHHLFFARPLLMDILHAAGESVIKIKSELKKFLVQRNNYSRSAENIYYFVLQTLQTT